MWLRVHQLCIGLFYVKSIRVAIFSYSTETTGHNLVINWRFKKIETGAFPWASVRWRRVPRDRIGLLSKLVWKHPDAPGRKRDDLCDAVEDLNPQQVGLSNHGSAGFQYTGCFEFKGAYSYMREDTAAHPRDPEKNTSGKRQRPTILLIQPVSSVAVRCAWDTEIRIAKRIMWLMNSIVTRMLQEDNEYFQDVELLRTSWACIH